MTFFHRKLWKQKPQAWGPVEAVRFVLRDRLEQLGIGWDDVGIASPLWSPGNQINYKSPAVIETNSGGIFLDNKLYFSGSSTYATFAQPRSDLVNGFSILFQWVDHDLTGNNNKGVFQHAVALTATTPVLLLKHGSSSIVWYLNGSYNTTISISKKNQKTALIWDTSNKYTAIQNDKRYTYSNYLSFNGGTHCYLGNGYSGHPQVSFEYFLNFTKTLPVDVVQDLLDNPYQLWQPKADTFYSFYQSSPIRDMAMDIQAFLSTANDIELDLSAYYQCIDQCPIDIYVMGNFIQDSIMDLSAALQVVEVVLVDVFIAGERIKNNFLDISLTDGILIDNIAMDISIGDGNKTQNMGMDCMAVSTMPEFKSIYAMHLNSAIREVVS